MNAYGQFRYSYGKNLKIKFEAESLVVKFEILENKQTWSWKKFQLRNESQ